MESIKEPPVLKQGVLGKLGGGAGGHKNWKDRYFVLTDHLYYYTNKAHFEKEPKNPLGRVNLNAYYVSKQDDSAEFEFCVHAYPKVRSLLVSRQLRRGRRTAQDTRRWRRGAPVPAQSHRPCPPPLNAAPRSR